MKKIISSFFSLILITLVYCGGESVTAQTPANRVSNRQVSVVIGRIDRRTANFRAQVDRSLDNSSLNGSTSEDSLNRYMNDFRSAIDDLSSKFNQRTDTSADVLNVLNRASFIEAFTRDYRLSPAAQREWDLLKTDLNTLARLYNVTWNQNATMPSPTSLPYTVNDSTLRTLITRLETDTDNFKTRLNNNLDRRVLTNSNQEAEVNRFVSDFEQATDNLKARFNSRQSASADVQEVLTRAYYIDNFVRSSRLSRAATQQWNLVRDDLNTLAGYYRVSWNWTTAPVNSNVGSNVGSGVGGSVPYKVSETTLRNLLSRIETNTNAYKRELGVALDRSILNSTRSEDTINAYVADFENATNRLRSNFDSRRSVGADVEEVLNRAYYINNFMRDYRLSTSAETQWNAIRTDLGTLSNYYNVSWNWNRQYIPATTFDANITGTYRLNPAQSDNVQEIVERAATNFYTGNQRDNLRRNLERRLTSPEMIAIEKRGNQVTIASSLSPQVSFQSDGVARTETTGNGRAIKITANTSYDGVGLSYEGDRSNDFYVNFMPLNNNQLRVVRRLYLENRNETVTVASVYDRVDRSANFSMVARPNNTGSNNTNYNDFVIPNGTQMTAILNSTISTATAVDGDRFTMEVRSPSQYNGAVIEGYLSNTSKSGRITGRAQMTFNFETIRLANGSTYRFEGLIDQVRQPNGNTVSVNNEGAIRDGSQGTRTATRAGIGAALGAIVGAIIGGGQGAAIGAGVGAGAGAGTVILQGRDNLELRSGAEVNLTSSAPANLRANR